MSRIYIFAALKSHLKAQKITYAALAVKLNLAEASVKRMFALSDCSLERLDEICSVLGISLTEVIRSTPRPRNLVTQLTFEQEAELVHNRALLMCAICTMSLWSFDDIVAHSKLSEADIFKLLRRLEQIGFLELHPANRYKLLVARDFSWILGGPIMKMIKGMADEFFDHDFDGVGELIKIINVRISPESAVQFKRRLEQLAEEYGSQVAADAHLPLEVRSPLSICIAVRRWVPDLLLPLLRFSESKSSAS